MCKERLSLKGGFLFASKPEEVPTWKLSHYKRINFIASSDRDLTSSLFAEMYYNLPYATMPQPGQMSTSISLLMSMDFFKKHIKCVWKDFSHLERSLIKTLAKLSHQVMQRGNIMNK